ncbi:hypothetical protein LJC45_02465 [Alistipes sp. OttesenSCG-928-B03]|nr:hypothetical protein [Alistipes sp. OttesenSCG-928-B03]
MKRLLIFMAGVLGFGLVSCQQNAIDGIDPGRTGTKDGMRITVTAEKINTGAEEATRATVDAASGETNINSLYLLFFDYEEDGSGRFVKSEKIENPTMNMQRAVSFSGINVSSAYTILALANFENYMNDFDAFMGALDGKTERAVLEQTALAIEGEPGNDEDSDSQVVASDDLPMSVRLVKEADLTDVTVNLVRGVSRFDVYNNPKNMYDLVSASIWNAAKTTAGWKDVSGATPDRTERFYGVKQARNENSEGVYEELPNIVGGLYSFESFVGAPEQDDKKTTCLIIGLVPRSNAPEYDDADPDKVHYYRVNVHPVDLAQSLKRNYVYKVTIRGVSGEGYGSEGDAWKGTESRLVVNINNWDLDDEGIIQTNGTSTLAIPVKRVRLNPDGDEREYSIFTMGPGVLSMSEVDLPAGIGVTLDPNTKTLKILATEMDPGEAERKGSVTINFAGMSGTITIIQNESSDKFLDLNRYNLPAFPSFGISGISDGGYLVVNSSGPWTAKIYNVSNNTSGDTNDRFSFNAGTNQATLSRDGDGSTGGNGGSNEIRIYSRVDNDKTEVRYSFVTISLASDPDINRTLILMQKEKTELAVTPLATSISFDPIGKPLGTAAGNTPSAGSPLTFQVNPGSTDVEGTPTSYRWKAELSGDDAQYFEIVMIDGSSVTQGANVQGVGSFEVRAKGAANPARPGDYGNYLGRTLNAKVTVTHLSVDGANPGATVEMALTQQPAGLEVTTGNKIVSVKGGYADDISISVPAGMTWSAEVISNSTSGSEWDYHTAYILDSDNSRKTKVENKSTTVKLRVGFDKIYYPMVGITPQAEVRIWVHQIGAGEGALAETVTISQNALVARDISIVNAKTASASYASLDESYDYFRAYARLLKNGNLFGPSGIVKTNNSVSGAISNVTANLAAATISPTANYLHNGSRPNEYSTNWYARTLSWWQNTDTDGVSVWANDRSNASPAYSSTSSILNKAGLVYVAPSGDPNPLNAGYAHRFMDYLLNGDGPFGSPTNTSLSYYNDGASSAMSTSSLRPDYQIPVIMNNSTSSGKAILVVDVKNRIVCIGECQMFQIGHGQAYSALTTIGSMTAPGTSYDVVACNLIAYVINTAQYGSHFSDLFIQGSDERATSIELYNKAFK